MNFNDHSKLEGKHAFLSASNYHWLNYDLVKLAEVYRSAQAKERGTELHKFAKDAIRLGQRLQKSPRTLNLYVNDAIGFRMTPEQILYYSENCFGTADTISFDRKKLRVHDLKTGSTPASMAQLSIYSALFCLEYSVSPFEIEIEQRIYQNDEVQVYVPTAHEIKSISDQIIIFDREIEKLKVG